MSDSCCAPESNCCEAADVRTESANKSLTIFVSLIAAFVLGDYLLPSMLEGKLNENLLFFITHSFGLIGLLGAITTAAVFARSFIDADKVRDHMSKINTVKGHGIAAGIGVATPFCSCSAVPVFTGFVRSGVPVSQAISPSPFPSRILSTVKLPCALEFAHVLISRITTNR